MNTPSHDSTRRAFLQVAAASAVGASLSPRAFARRMAGSTPPPTLRWGIVGTGQIASSMASSIKAAQSADLAAVSSRRLESAQAFAERYGTAHAFDSWEEMANSDKVDALYVATPTSVREEICIAAARGGKHVLGEKPLASLASVDRILAACRENDVAFMDGTHFSHHPRTRELQARRDGWIGATTLVDSSCAFNLQDRSNIRYNTELEPMGAIGDAGWYNMRAAVECLPPGVKLESVSAVLRRDKETGAAMGGSGELRFEGGLRSTWTCGFDASPSSMHVHIEGADGQIEMPGFLFQDSDHSARLEVKRAGGEPTTHRIASGSPGSVLMFEDMAAAAADPSLRAGWANRTRRTQALLDAVWHVALAAEASGR
ncbi:Glucose--fructose oxidoreductase precursor [Planctomycetes bacterium Poly30]|uniref:Glucose--fructose oxidoreductase n=1 Tax=Saltatorellus ferox TaxID=2528018 RepID=A0A518ET23_9BACT|nr:Glucose--fructose oxidoreductase precursor [Planctomycetes bacterium Poly30]